MQHANNKKAQCEQRIYNDYINLHEYYSIVADYYN